jgi:hypothetical protein
MLSGRSAVVVASLCAVCSVFLFITQSSATGAEHSTVLLAGPTDISDVGGSSGVVLRLCTTLWSRKVADFVERRRQRRYRAAHRMDGGGISKFEVVAFDPFGACRAHDATTLLWLPHCP